MRRTVNAGVLALAVSAVAVLWHAQASAQAAAPASAVERGNYLVTLGGCHDCHTPKKMGPHGPEPDMARMLAGHPAGVKVSAPVGLPQPWLAATTGDLTAWSGPWGVSFATNLTPDETTGMGIWTEEMFVKAMRTGRHMGTSRPILPPMPWQNLATAKEEDLKAMFAYLRSIPPVKNRVPEPLPPAAAGPGSR